MGQNSVSQPVEHGALEAKLLDAAFQFVGTGIGVAGGQAGEGGKPVGSPLNHVIEPVVDAPGAFDGFVGIEGLRAGGAMGQHLHIDAGFIHFPKAQLA